VAGVVSVLFHRYNESRRARTDDCRRLRDLVAELNLTAMRTGNADGFDFRPLGVRRWEEAPQDLLRREDADLYDVCLTAYDIIDALNAGSADARRRGELQHPDEGAAKRDVRASLKQDRDWILLAHSRLSAYVAKRCG
jgi:hypothetical protein